MTAIPEFVDAVRRQQRAARHTTSLVLAVNTVAVGLLTVLNSRLEWRYQLWTVLLPGVVYLVLWLAVRLRRSFTGIGSRREGFGLMGTIALGALVGVPLMSPVMLFLGPGAFLGLCLVVVGIRMRESVLWGSGLSLMAACPLVSLGVFENHAAFLGPQPGTLVLATLGAGLLGLASLAYLRELAELREPVLP